MGDGTMAGRERDRAEKAERERKRALHQEQLQIARNVGPSGNKAVGGGCAGLLVIGITAAYVVFRAIA